MEQTLRQRVVGVWVAAGAVFVSSFMPWGSALMKPTVTISGMDQGGLPFPMPFPSMRVTLNGWSGSTTLLGLSLPNWFPVALALAAAGVATLRTTGAWDPPRWLPSVLAGVGLAQVLATTLVLAAAQGASPEVGIFVAIASLIGLLVACSRLKASSSPLPSGT